MIDLFKQKCTICELWREWDAWIGMHRGMSGVAFWWVGKGKGTLVLVDTS
jgi:hypothetical protein